MFVALNLNGKKSRLNFCVRGWGKSLPLSTRCAVSLKCVITTATAATAAAAIVVSKGLLKERCIVICLLCRCDPWWRWGSTFDSIHSIVHCWLDPGEKIFDYDTKTGRVCVCARIGKRSCREDWENYYYTFCKKKKKRWPTAVFIDDYYLLYRSTYRRNPPLSRRREIN